MGIRRGRLIALYGVNNLGKTTQSKLLVDRMRESGLSVLYLKYPLYDLEPTGPEINAYLRKGNPHGWSPTCFQLANTMNRLAYDPTLRATLAAGTHVVCEDYRGGGLAWGMGAGVDGEMLWRINKRLADEDVAFLLDGVRFCSNREAGHAHEDDDVLTNGVQAIFRDLAQRFGWVPISANRPLEEVHDHIWAVVSSALCAAA